MNGTKKNTLSIYGNKVKFEEAAEVFFDDLCEFGNASVEEETREFIIGFSFSFNLLYTVFVERGERLRIISARPATAEEEKIYAGKK